MHGYVTTESLVLQTQGQIKAIPAVDNLTEASVTAVQIEAGEFEFVKKQLIEKFNEKDLDNKLRLARDEEIAQWEHFPPRLGRVSLGLIESGKTFDHQNEKAPLRQQLQLLKERHPDKKNFRFALVNGFGGNLGDALVGITAFRQVASVLEAELTNFSIDILYGWTTNPACRDLFAHEPYIQNVFFSGLSLVEFGHYDAHFDISGLIYYAKYDSLPAVDWYLWWLGMEPEEIDPENKRNRLTFPYSAWQVVETHLRGVPGKRIMFCHKASVSLRSIPEKQARRLLTELLNQDESLTIVLDSTLDIKHPRVLDLDGKIDSPDKFKALIAQVDGLITIDSFALHVADATATPTVLLSVSLPLERYPYYPHMAGLLIKGATTLPAWMKVKTSAEEWNEMEPAYSKAWQSLKGEAIWSTLKDKITQRIDLLAKAPVQFNFAEIAPRARFTHLHEGPAYQKHVQWINEHTPEACLGFNSSLERLGKALLRPGCIVVHAGSGSASTPVRLAEFIHPRGEYHLWEPRRLYAQTQAANFMLAGLDSLYLNQAMPVDHIGSISFPAIDPYSESNPIRPGNALSPQLVNTSPIDAQPFSMCRLLVIQPPMPYVDVLAGAKVLISKYHPFVIIGPIPETEAGDTCKPLLDFGYQLWAESVGKNHRGSECHLIIGVPAGSDVNMQGFMRIELN